MSRRPPTSADTAERNRAALKTLTKLEHNKMCADCKRNKHPRWASWNLGIFVCIRCSGIHRSLGVHISRVKSIDLDSWTDEQMQSVLRWGNKRANRYWEAKLAEGHVPNDSKIESFIRTKYDSKRWVMDGPMPDPATLDHGEDDDDNVPLKVVQDRAMAIGGSGGAAPARNGTAMAQPPRTRPQDVDLFGDSTESAQPARPSTTEPAINRPGPPEAPLVPPKQTKPGEGLLGLDFFGGTQSTPPQRSSSTGPTTPGMPGRTDLKQSILSLYASKPTAPPQQPQTNVSVFGGMQSSLVTSPTHQQQSNMAGLDDAFSSLSFGAPQQAEQQPKADFFGGLSSHTGTAPDTQPSMNRSNPLSGGGFFDAKPAPPPKQTAPAPRAREPSFGDSFGDFSSGPLPSASTTKSPLPPTESTGDSMGDLFNLASPPPLTSSAAAAAKSPPPISASNYMNSQVFNLSSPSQLPAPKPLAPAQTSSIGNFGALNNMDAWSSNDAWATPDPAPAPAPATGQPPPEASTQSFAKPAVPAASMKMESAFDSGWAEAEPAPKPTAAPAASVKMERAFDSGWAGTEPAPKPTAAPAASSGFGATSSGDGFGQSGGRINVQQDEEFGGWSHASPVASTSGSKQGGLGTNSDDLFGNVWE